MRLSGAVIVAIASAGALTTQTDAGTVTITEFNGSLSAAAELVHSDGEFEGDGSATGSQSVQATTFIQPPARTVTTSVDYLLDDDPPAPLSGDFQIDATLDDPAGFERATVAAVSLTINFTVDEATPFVSETFVGGSGGGSGLSFEVHLDDAPMPSRGVLGKGEHLLSFDLRGLGHRTFSGTTNASMSFQLVPEPSGAALLVIGGGCAALYRRPRAT